MLVTTIYVKSPLEFAVFPSLLLAVTLFRLVLNVATTRLILTAGDRRADRPRRMHAAGEVVMAFSQFVTGGSLAVGIIIFIIIFVIQFVVITKGATRISEVAARFTLDAMPGKQMAIDADLNAGIITEAAGPRAPRGRSPRRPTSTGRWTVPASSSAATPIAGIIITFVNILGGLLRRHGRARLGRHGVPEALHQADDRRRPGQPDPGVHRLAGAGLIVTRTSSRRRTSATRCSARCSPSRKALIVAAVVPGADERSPACRCSRCSILGGRAAAGSRTC